jgi:hypothetical protein
MVDHVEKRATSATCMLNGLMQSYYLKFKLIVIIVLRKQIIIMQQESSLLQKQTYEGGWGRNRS